MRKIAVEIKVIDDRHCSPECRFYHHSSCILPDKGEDWLHYDETGYLRTAACINSEIKEEG